MKILIADDNVARIAKIVGFLTSQGIPRDSLHERRTARDTRVFLQSNEVDLLLLDLLLPNRVEDEPTLDSSIHLLNEICDTDNLIRPRKVLGLTAYSEAAQQASPSFQAQTWTVIESSDISDGWLHSIASCVRYLEGCRSQQGQLDYKLDLLVLTALRDPELSAVRRLPWSWEPEEPIDDVLFVSRGRVQSGGRDLSVISSHTGRMGMVATAVRASRLIEKYRPRLCVMVGICAGVRGKAMIGDVVFADSCWDYQSGKFVREDNLPGFHIDPHHISAPAEISSKVDNLSSDNDLLTNIWREWPQRPPNPPRIIRAPVGSGSAVLADAEVTDRIVQQSRRVAGIEMELYGLYFAGEQASAPRPLVFGLKSVCDFADAEKNDGHQAYASYVSAAVLHAFVSRFGETLCRVPSNPVALDGG